MQTLRNRNRTTNTQSEPLKVEVNRIHGQDMYQVEVNQVLIEDINSMLDTSTKLGASVLQISKTADVGKWHQDSQNGKGHFLCPHQLIHRGNKVTETTYLLHLKFGVKI